MEPPAGAVRSIVVVTTSSPVLPALSVATTRSARSPSASSGHEAPYGAAASVPSETQVPDAQSALPFEQRKNSTWARSVAALVAVSENGSASPAFTYAPGAVRSTAGAVVSTFAGPVVTAVERFPTASATV